MAARTLYPAQEAMNWSASSWSLADDNAKNQVKPAAGDSVHFTVNSGNVTLDENTAVLVNFDIDPAYTGTLDLGNKTLTSDGECDLSGTITGTAGATIDSGEGYFNNRATIADAVQLLLTTSGSDFISWTGTGGTVNINCTGTYILMDACNSYALTHTAGTLAGNGKTWTVGAGGFEPKAGAIFTGTLTVDLSAGAGAYVQTNGTIAADAVLNVTTGTGAITYTALTKTGTGVLNVTGAENANIGWNSDATGRITLLTINAGKTLTQTATVVFRSFVGPGTLAGAAKTTIWKPGSNGDVCSGVITGTEIFYISPTATPLTLATSLAVGARTVNFTYSGGSVSLALSGLISGPLIIAPTAAGTVTLTLNGNSAGTTITLGSATATTYVGEVVFGAGYTHTWTGAIQRAGTGTANALTFGGRMNLGGNVTLAGITPNFGSAYILGAKTLPTINGASAGTVANAAAVIARCTITNLTGPAANKIVAYYHKGERALFDGRLPKKARDSYNCKLSTGNTNIRTQLVVARQPNRIRASSRRVRRCARGLGRGRIALTRKDNLRN